MEITIPIITNTIFDLSKIDFSFKDISIYNIKSEEFENYIEEQQKDFKKPNLVFYDDIKDRIFGKYDEKYAIVKNNPKDNFSYPDIIKAFYLLLIIYPSDLQIEYEITYLYENNFFQRSNRREYRRRHFSTYPGNIFKIENISLECINDYVKIVFDKIQFKNYIGIALQNFITSFEASHWHFQFLTLMIALESIVHGNQELTYRLKRNVSILCGIDKEDCSNIFKQLTDMYSVRSKIVHGGDYDTEVVYNHIIPLQKIVASTIKELLLHNIEKNEELNIILTEIGYGDRSKISKNWKIFKF